MKRENKSWIAVPLLCLSICVGFVSCFPSPDYEKEQEQDIKNFVNNSEYVFEEKESGIYYYEYISGVGARPADNDTVSIHWSTFLLTNLLLNTNFGDDPVDFIIGSGELVEGVNEALTYMKPGGKSYVIVPSYLGYGNYTAYYDPYTPLIFYLELVDVRYYNQDK